MPTTQASLCAFASTSRVAAKSLVAALDATIAAAKEPDLAARARALPVALKRGRVTLARQAAQNPALERASAGSRHEGAAGERALEIRELLARAAQSWPRKGTPANDVAAWAASARTDLATVVAMANQITIEHDVREALTCVAVGKSLDFDVAFADQIPDAAERHRLLVQLANDACIGGAVDVANGQIFKLSPDRWRRVLTYLSPLFFFALAGGLLIAVGRAFPGDLQVRQWYEILGPYVLVVSGVVAHLGVENLKQMQIGKVQILAINDFLNWLNLRWLGLAATYFPIVVTVIGLRAAGTVGTGRNATLLWITAGFSVDSIAGTILTRFDSGSALSKQLTGLLKPAPATAD